MYGLNSADSAQCSVYGLNSTESAQCSVAGSRETGNKFLGLLKVVKILDH